ncbi:RNA polymerase sigma factor [Sunxiuqinia sp. A32]|uniref:RNA polymerase sigma factor n=1 Tax=Sunxiuqinia sp. A32 TaxID=3461496 RepID=UPI004045379E
MKDFQASQKNNINDLQLIEKIRNGDYRAFRLLFETYHTPLCNFSVSYVSQYVIADDIVQEVFIKIWEKRRKLFISGSVKSYLYTAVKNHSLNRLKSEAIRQEHTHLFSVIQDESIVDSEIELEEFRNYLFQCIEQLPPRCKDVFLESRFKGSKQEMIANTYDITVKTVKAQIGKALKMLKDCLQISYPEYF